MLKLNWFIRQALSFLLLALTLAAPHGAIFAEGNSGSTTTTIPFVFVSSWNAGDSCFDSANWCAEEVTNALASTLDPGVSTDAFANAACDAAAVATTSLGGYLEVSGALSLTRRGKSGPVQHISFQTELEYAQLAIVFSDTAASTTSEAGAFVVANSSNIDEICFNLDFQDTPLAEFCASHSIQVGLETEASAWSMSSAFSAALAGAGVALSQGAMSTVYATDIQEFHALVSSGVSSFAGSDSDSLAQTWANAYETAFAESLAEACTSIEVLDIFLEDCIESSVSSEALAEALAQSFAEAGAAALAMTEFTIFLPVSYISRHGKEDTLSFGSGSTVNHNVVATSSCSVPTLANGG